MHGCKSKEGIDSYVMLFGLCLYFSGQLEFIPSAYAHAEWVKMKLAAMTVIITGLMTFCIEPDVALCF